MGNAAITGADGSGNKISRRSTEEEIEDFIEKEVNSHKAVVWCKSHCFYCLKAVETLKKRCDDVIVYKLDDHKLGGNVLLVLEKKTGMSSVPNIFINGEHIGGNTDLQTLKKAKELKVMLKKKKGEDDQ
jgi:glutaredoxin 3